MRAAVLGLLLLGCGPVMLGEEARMHDAGTRPDAAATTDADAATTQDDAATTQDDADAATSDAAVRPSVAILVQPIDCGKCFELQAVGAGGAPPYQFEWEDGSQQAMRRVCVESAVALVSVVARDAVAARSLTQSLRLESLADAGCPHDPPPTAATPPALLCLENPSFEGTPVPNLGQADAFDGAPWSTCTSAAMPASTTNVPAIANESIAQTIAIVPKATEGLTYLALGEGAQVSQGFCSTVDAGASLSLALDLSRVDLSQVGVPDRQIFLEIWGGLAVDCSQRELLWASPALTVGWKPYCVTLHLHSFINQITLRANADATSSSPAYLLVDNLRPMDKCP